jgi:hypothetical protein
VNRGGTQPLAEYRTIEEIDEAYGVKHCKRRGNMLIKIGCQRLVFGAFMLLDNLRNLRIK